MTSKLIVNSIRHTGASADAITMDASGNVTFPANATCSGTATGFGKILQVVIAQTATQASTASSTFAEITTDLRATIVPTSATSKIIVDVSLYLSSNQQTACIRILKDGSTMVSGATTSGSYDGDGTAYYAANWMGTFNRTVFETAGNTNSRYYTPFWARNAGTAYLNRYQASATYLGTSSIRVMEVAA
tara:strand:- start:86 stop:652 length:567 start_codon:yes stop_codon:yes gene_type:complete